MSVLGRARNARLNQAIKHANVVLDNLAVLSCTPKHTVVDKKDEWADARNALEQLVQCFHEASAYNNALLSTKPRSSTVRTPDFDSENPGSNPGAAANG